MTSKGPIQLRTIYVWEVTHDEIDGCHGYPQAPRSQHHPGRGRRSGKCAAKARLCHLVENQEDRGGQEFRYSIVFLHIRLFHFLYDLLAPRSDDPKISNPKAVLGSMLTISVACSSSSAAPLES